eukprot:TRINITY_DN25764_c0_g1_i1.p3 TRINITY_DN25764_c0_g1~~TRINITY_DN25764_c0_g1_i1.p3  ORF type:complete len:123 (+),score=9.34 TRINITY_DN25764_c0_g1_i1:404-772(+)
MVGMVSVPRRKRTMMDTETAISGASQVQQRPAAGCLWIGHAILLHIVLLGHEQVHLQRSDGAVPQLHAQKWHEDAVEYKVYTANTNVLCLTLRSESIHQLILGQGSPAAHRIDDFDLVTCIS